VAEPLGYLEKSNDPNTDTSPGVDFRCGSYAMAEVTRVLQQTNPAMVKLIILELVTRAT